MTRGKAILGTKSSTQVAERHSMLQQDQIDHAVGATAYDDSDAEIGKVGEVYLDDETGAPAWATVTSGLLGTKESFVPLGDATLEGDRLRVPYSKDRVENAPKVSEDGHLSPDQERELYTYYGADQAQAADAVDGAVTLSEERLSVVETERRPAGRARLRKYVVTENVTVTIPVRKEKAVLEYVPDDEAAADTSDRDDEDIIRELTAASAHAGEPPEVVLHEEVPEITLRTEAVERVRLATEEVTEQVTVTEEVRKERVATEGDVTDGRTGQQL